MSAAAPRTTSGGAAGWRRLLLVVTGALQAFIFMLLSIIYLQGAVAVEHEHDAHGHDAPDGHQAPASA